MAKRRVKAKARGRSRVTSLKPAITLTEAMANPDLFGKVFASPSFWTWKVVAKRSSSPPSAHLVGGADDLLVRTGRVHRKRGYNVSAILPAARTRRRVFAGSHRPR
jgi:hypothetical protein